LGKAFELPVGAPDFPCPFGLPWGADTQPTAALIKATIPLAGDIIAALAARFGADRVSKWLARVVGAKSCGCSARQAKLNRMHAAARKWLGK
jgi:hypothetical protein